MASMMDEMAKTLARRRAAAEKKQPEQPPVSDDNERVVRVASETEHPSHTGDL